MIPSTLQGIALFLAFVAPGLLYEQGVERSLGYWRTGLPDRVLRFFIESVILQALASPGTYWLWHSYFLSVKSGWSLATADVGLYFAVLGYVFVPIVLGFIVGANVRRRPDAWWAQVVFGRDPAPRRPHPGHQLTMTITPGYTVNRTVPRRTNQADEP